MRLTEIIVTREKEYVHIKGTKGIYRNEERKSAPASNAVVRLAAYEDAEEQGRLVILPCKVGDRVYRIHTHDHIEEQYIMAIHFSASGVWYWDETGRETPVEKIGKTVFLSREEAEAALKGEREDV